MDDIKLLAITVVGAFGAMAVLFACIAGIVSAIVLPIALAVRWVIS